MNPQDSQIHSCTVVSVIGVRVPSLRGNRPARIRRGTAHGRRGNGAAPGGDGHPAAGRRRDARGPARAAHAEGALHGRRLGVPRRRGRHDGGRGRRGAPHRRHPRARGGGRDRPRRPGRAREVLPVDHAARGEDPLRHALLPRAGAAGPGAAHRRRRMRRRRLGRAAGRAGRLPPRRARTRLPDDQAPRAARRVPQRRGAARPRARARRRAGRAAGDQGGRDRADRAARRGRRLRRLTVRTPRVRAAPRARRPVHYIRAMLSTLPPELHQAAERYLTCELVTIDGSGRPIAWPVTPYFRAAEGCIDVTTGVGYPKKADDAERNPRVAMLFSDPTGSGVADAPMVLVQGIARVDDSDLEANRRRFEDEMARKLPALHALAPTGPMKRFFSWYYDRIYLHVRPERVYVWSRGEVEAEPALYDAHVEEVRSGHNEEPEEGHAPPEGGMDVWDPRLDRLGTDDATAVLAFVGPDGFPFAVRVPVRADQAAHVVRIEADPVGAPIEAGPACLCAHSHAEDLTWQHSFQVRGDLVEEGSSFVLHPHRIVAGLQLPQSAFERYRVNVRKILRFRRTARERTHSRAGAGTPG